MRAALIAVFTAIVMIIGLSVPAQAQELEECDASGTVCALVQGNHVIIMLLGNEVLNIEMPEPGPSEVTPVANPPGNNGQGGGNEEPKPAETVEVPVPGPTVEVTVPGPTVTATATVTATPKPTTSTPKPAQTITTTTTPTVFAMENYTVSGPIPDGAVAVERAVRFGLGILLLLSVLVSLGALGAYAMGYRLRKFDFGGRHR